MFAFDFLVELLCRILWSSSGRDQGRLGESPIERQQKRFWRWIGAVTLILVLGVAVYSWSSRH